MSDSNEFKKIAEDLIEKVQKERKQAKDSKETIWDYKPTEKELKKIGEKTGYTQEEIITESHTGEGRFWCLETLFDLRGNKKDLARVERWHAICFPYVL